jgi:hypothetical protein
VNAADFAGGTFPSGTLTFAAGETSKTITVDVAGDTLVEGDENFTVTLTNPANATIMTAAAAGVVRNDDVGPPSLAIAATAANKSEGNSGTTAFLFTVTRSGDATAECSVSWAASGGGTAAANAGDFVGGVFPNGTLIFAAGETSKTIAVDVAGDTTVEKDENFSVILSNAVGAAITTASAMGWIRNDDLGPPTLAIAVASASKSEGNTGTTAFTFLVKRSADAATACSVSWAVSGSGSAMAIAADFIGGTLPSGVLAFAAGETSKTITIDVAGDTAVEPDEGFAVTLSNPIGATVTTAVAAGLIRNDDVQPSLSIAAAAANKPEGNAGTTALTFAVIRSGDASGVCSVSWAVSGSGAAAANAGDFANGVFPTGMLTFAAGETSKTVAVDVAGDATIEADESFIVTLSNANGATIKTAAATGIVRDDDAPLPSITIVASGADKAEGNSATTAYTFTLTRVGGTKAAASVRWMLAGVGANATAGDDFVNGVFPTGTVSFAAGQVTRTIVVSVVADTAVEQDEEFEVSLVSAKGALISTPTARGVIRNDDLPTLLSIAAVSSDRVEGNSGRTSFTFLVTRSGNAALPAAVRWVVSGTSANPATASDFAGGKLPSGSLAFAKGELTKQIVVTITGDQMAEADEAFAVSLVSPSRATITTGTANGVIRNDDGLPGLVAGNLLGWRRSASYAAAFASLVNAPPSRPRRSL